MDYSELAFGPQKPYTGPPRTPEQVEADLAKAQATFGAVGIDVGTIIKGISGPLKGFSDQRTEAQLATSPAPPIQSTQESDGSGTSTTNQPAKKNPQFTGFPSFSPLAINNSNVEPSQVTEKIKNLVKDIPGPTAKSITTDIAAGAGAASSILNPNSGNIQSKLQSILPDTGNLKDSIKNVLADVGCLAKRTAALTSQVSKTAAQVSILTSNASRLATQLGGTGNQVSSTLTQIGNTTRQITSVTSQVNSSIRQSTTLANRIPRTAAQISKTFSRSSTFSGSVTGAASEISRATTQISNVTRDVATLSAKITGACGTAAQIGSIIGLAAALANSKDCSGKSTITDTLSEITGAISKVNKVINQVSSITSQVKGLVTSVENFKLGLNGPDVKICGQSSKLASIALQASRITSQASSIASRVSRLTTSVTNLVTPQKTPSQIAAENAKKVQTYVTSASSSAQIAVNAQSNKATESLSAKTDVSSLRNKAGNIAENIFNKLKTFTPTNITTKIPVQAVPEKNYAIAATGVSTETDPVKNPIPADVPLYKAESSQKKSIENCVTTYSDYLKASASEFISKVRSAGTTSALLSVVESKQGLYADWDAEKTKIINSISNFTPGKGDIVTNLGSEKLYYQGQVENAITGQADLIRVSSPYTYGTS